MPATTKVPLGPGVLAKRWYLDINTGTYGAPTWTGIFGIEDLKAPVDPTVQKNSDYDSTGWGSSGVTERNWSMELKLARKVTTASATAYDPGQEALRAAADAAGTVDVRWYEMTASGPKVEAYRGYAGVTWSEDGGGTDVFASVTCKLTGQGARTAITHPDGAAVVPVLYSVAPAVGIQAGGTLHTVRGVGFFAAGVADVQSILLGVTNVPTFTTHSDNELVFLAPVKAAGQFIIYVTNTVGKSVTTSVIIDVT